MAVFGDVDVGFAGAGVVAAGSPTFTDTTGGVVAVGSGVVVGAGVVTTGVVVATGVVVFATGVVTTGVVVVAGVVVAGTVVLVAGVVTTGVVVTGVVATGVVAAGMVVVAVGSDVAGAAPGWVGVPALGVAEKRRRTKPAMPLRTEATVATTA